MPEDPDRRLPPALEAFGADFARTMERAREQRHRHRHRGRFSTVSAALGRSGRRNGTGWRRLWVLAFLAVSATAAAATIPLLGGSHGLTGQVPKPALTSPAGPSSTGSAGGPVRLPNGLRYAIPVTPDIEAGDTGWCSTAEFTLPGARTRPIGGGSACAPSYPHAVTVLAGGVALTNVLPSPPTAPGVHATGGPPSSPSVQQAARHDVWMNWLIVRDTVATIRIRNASFTPRANSDLKPGWRAVVIFTRGLLTNPVLLDRHDRPINQVGTETFAPPIPVTTVNPHHLPPAVCSLGASDLPGVASQWEVIAERAPHRGQLVAPDALFSCVRAWYSFPTAGGVYSAAILLNAQNPARDASDLPGLTPGRRPGEYQEAAASTGQITARRIGNAWLLVQGPNPRQRARLLESLATAGTALHQ